MYNKENQPIKLKPFVKWAGGKTQFLEIINLLLPLKYNTFIELFVGGGAVFLNIKPKQLVINDINSELLPRAKETYHKNKGFMFIVAGFREWLGKIQS